MTQEYWRQLRQPVPFLPSMFDGAVPMIPAGQSSVGMMQDAGMPDAMLSGLVEQYLAGMQGGGAVSMPELDPSARAELEKAVRDRFQALNQGGLSLEGRPGSKAAEALANGDLSDLSSQELMQLLVALMEYAENKRNPGRVAQQHSAPVAPTGSWGQSGNSYGGGGSYTGANSSAAAPAGPAPKAGPIPEGSPSGTKLAQTARDVAEGMNSTGWCYRGVSTAVAQATGVQL